MPITATAKKRLREHSAAAAAILVAIAGFIWLSSLSQEGDPNFDAHVAHPAYSTSHPRVYFDGGRWNVSV